MFSGAFGLGHWLVVLLIVVLVFGTKRLTSGAKDLGNAVREFKKGVRGDDDTAPARLNDESRGEQRSRDTQAERDHETR